MKIKLHESSNLSLGTARGFACPSVALAKEELPPCPQQMKNLTLNQAIKETIKVASKMPNKKEWLVHNNFAAMVEEVGELGNAIQVTEGFKSKKRRRSEVADSICDILYELFRIAKWYKVDLDKEYPLVLKQINNRRKQGEFDHE